MEYTDQVYDKVMRGLVIAGFIAVGGFAYTCGTMFMKPDECQDTVVVINPNYATDYRCPPGSKGELITNPPGLLCRCITSSGADKPSQPTR